MTLALWLLVAAGLLWWRWNAVRYWGLGDTDDNLRLQQVRDWLGGQGWFDLRQRRLGWPDGFDIHWSRLVDLPIAGLMAGLRPIAGPAWAERLAIGVAPLLPLGVIMPATAAVARRLVGASAFALALAILLTAQAVLGMVQPTRIDHHGWQLASVALLLVGLTDPDRRRGGIVAALATALSLTIGLEMLPYLALGGAAVALRWMVEPAEERRLTAYGLTLAPAVLIGYLLFASAANRQPRCDALSPVWLTVMLAAAVAAVLVGRIGDERPLVRLAAVGAAGAIVAAVLAVGFPQCLGAPEAASPELRRLWLDNVREAKPIFRQDREVMVGILALPLTALIGLALVAWRERWQALPWLPVALLALASVGLLFWQARAGPAAQLLAVPGATALGMMALARVRGWTGALARVTATVTVFLLVTGLGPAWLAKAVEREQPQSTTARAVNRAGARCPAVGNLHVLDRLPPARMMTFIDLGPRLLVTTHHSAVAGPYHRNGQAILDVAHFFGGPAQDARAIARRRGSQYVLICPGAAESTLYQSRNKDGIYARLVDGRVPDWLVPVALPRRSPFKLYRVVDS